MQYFCKQKACKRTQLVPPVKEQPLSLEVTGVGTAVVEVGQDPADAVEAFTAQANAAGHGIDGEGMMQMMEFFCKQKTCVRTQLVQPATEQPITLEVQGVGTAVVQPGQDPADAVEEFAAQAIAAGHEITGEGMTQMMEYFCQQKACVRTQLTLPAAREPAMDLDALDAVDQDEDIQDEVITLD